MGKGINNQSCKDAIFACFARQQRALPYSHILTVVRTRGPWTDATIRRSLMSAVENLVPAHHEWPSRKRFLFLRADGRYELYNHPMHPKPIP